MLKYAVNALKPVANCSQDAKRETTASSCLHHAECLFLIGYKIKTGKLNYALSCNFREQDLIGLVSSGTVQIPLTAGHPETTQLYFNFVHDFEKSVWCEALSCVETKYLCLL